MNQVSARQATCAVVTVEKWLSVRDVLLPAIERLGGTHTETDVFVMLVANQMQLWTFGRSAMITQILVHPRMKEISVFVAGGDLQELEAVEEFMAEYAVSQGCSRARLTGRQGWAHVAKRHPGFKPYAVILTRDLDV